jgi:hypothetical protein
MKFYRYKQVQRLTFFGHDDILKMDNNSLSKTSEQTTAVDVHDTKRLRFDVNKIASVQLSHNSRIVLESVYLPINSNIKTIQTIDSTAKHIIDFQTIQTIDVLDRM